MAHGFAELTLAEADILRRAMSGKFRSRIEFQKLVDKWFANCERLAYSEELAKEVWRQIEMALDLNVDRHLLLTFRLRSLHISRDYRWSSLVDLEVHNE